MKLFKFVSVLVAAWFYFRLTRGLLIDIGTLFKIGFIVFSAVIFVWITSTLIEGEEE